MDAQVPTHFATTLNSLGLLSVAKGQNPPPYFVPHGEYALASNTALCRRLCNTVAEETGAFWTFIAFTRLQNTPQIAPPEPKSDDPSFWPAKNATLPADLLAKHGPTVTRKLVAARNYNNARNAYETALKKYQKLQLQILDIRQNHGFDDRGYVAFVLKALRMDFPAFVESFFFTPSIWPVGRRTIPLRYLNGTSAEWWCRAGAERRPGHGKHAPGRRVGAPVLGVPSPPLGTATRPGCVGSGDCSAATAGVLKKPSMLEKSR